MLPGKRDFYRWCKARPSASHINKEFCQQFQNYAPPTLRVIRTKFARTVYIYQRFSIEPTWECLAHFARSPIKKIALKNIGYLLEKWFPLQSEWAHSLKLFCMYDKRLEI